MPTCSLPRKLRRLCLLAPSDDDFFTTVDNCMDGTDRRCKGNDVRRLVELRDKLTPVGSRKDPAAPKWSPEFVTNEFIPFV